MPGPVEMSHVLELDFPEDLKETALEYGEDPDKTCELMQQFKDMIYELGECNPHRMDDEFLIKFLRARFWKLEPSYKLLCRYTKFREDNNHWIDKVHPLSLKSLGEEDIIESTPYRDQTGQRMLIYRFGNWKPSKTAIDEIFKASLIVLEIGIMEPRAQVLGGVGIFDLEAITMTHVSKMTPSLAQKMIAMMVTSLPYRATSIHIVNQGWLFDIAFAFFKPFLTQSMRDRLFFHGKDFKSLHKHINPECLPKKYGGMMEPSSYKPWIEYCKSNERVIRELELHGYCVDEINE